MNFLTSAFPNNWNIFNLSYTYNFKRIKCFAYLKILLNLIMSYLWLGLLNQHVLAQNSSSVVPIVNEWISDYVSEPNLTIFRAS